MEYSQAWEPDEHWNVATISNSLMLMKGHLRI
jgi:hypothetical protein